MEMRELSDEDLVQEARGGSDAAFAALYVRYQRLVHARCFSVLRNDEEAADAAQNTMINAYRSLRRNGSPDNLRGWLLSIAHNESVSLLRRNRPSEPLEIEHHGAGPGADEGAFDRERLRQLVDDLQALPDRQRGALLLREASGFSYRRIASVLGTSAGNARQTVHQARRNMRQRRIGRDHGWLGWALPGLAGAWLVRTLGLQELAANLGGAGKAALLASALVGAGGAATQVESGGGLLGAAVPKALANPPSAQALAGLPRRLQASGPRVARSLPTASTRASAAGPKATTRAASVASTGRSAATPTATTRRSTSSAKRDTTTPASTRSRDEGIVEVSEHDSSRPATRPAPAAPPPATRPAGEGAGGGHPPMAMAARRDCPHGGQPQDNGQPPPQQPAPTS
jgi:RNA polymerase sigma factor (sigma-70 family)